MSSSSSAVYSSVRQYRSNDFTGISNALKLVTSTVNPPSRGEVAVRIHAVSLNYRDYIIAAGKYPGRKDLSGGGLIPGSDGAGEVIEVGEGVTEFKVGDKVATTFHWNWESGETHSEVGKLATGGTAQGTLTEIGVFPERALVHLPPGLSWEEGATLTCAPLTAWTALRDSPKPIGPESIVLVQGTGGVSVFAAQLAVATGSRVIATSSSDDKLAVYEKIGVKKGDLINYKKTPDWAAEVKKLAPNGVDHIVEVTGQLKSSLKCIKKGGIVTVIGFVGGNDQVSAMEILWSDAIVRAILVGSRSSFKKMNAAIEHNNIKPIVDKVFPFEQAVEAYTYLESQKHVGKVVIKVSK